MSLKLTNLLSYKNYFLDLATKHVDIEGFKWGEEKVIRNDNRSDMPANLLWAMPYEDARYSDSFSDNIMKTKLARVSYLEVRDSKLFDDEAAQFIRCEARIEEIMARVLRDKRGADVDGVWELIATTINSWKTEPVTMVLGSTTYLGYSLEMLFMDNANLAFDAEKWSDTLTS